MPYSTRNLIILLSNNSKTFTNNKISKFESICIHEAASSFLEISIETGSMFCVAKRTLNRAKIVSLTIHDLLYDMNMDDNILMGDENRNFKCSFILYDVEEEELIRND